MHTQNDFEYLDSVYKRYIYPSNYPFIVCEKWNYIRYASHRKSLTWKLNFIFINIWFLGKHDKRIRKS